MIEWGTFNGGERFAKFLDAPQHGPKDTVLIREIDERAVIQNGNGEEICLDRELARQLADILDRFADTGSLDPG